MSNNLVYTLAKVEYGRISDGKFKESVDAVQEELRKDYPVFMPNTETRVVKIQMTPLGQKVSETVIPMIMLTSPNKDWGVRISPEYMLLHTNNYQSFEEFNPRMGHLLEVVSQAMSIYHTAFVGIRYINKFRYIEKDAFTHIFRRQEFLQPELNKMGMLGSNLSAKYQSNDGWLKINSGVTVDTPKLPAELMEIAADLGETNTLLEGAWAHLDIDSFSTQQSLVEYDLDRVLSQLSSLRAHAKSTYQQIIFDTESNPEK